MKNYNAFTLVELIVVITILAILGTIAFMTLQGYSSDARNSVRITDLNSINKGLEIFSLDGGKYPQPENYITIFNSQYGIGNSTGVIIGEQGYVGENIKRITNVFGTLKDPSDDSQYVYYRSKDAKKYQLIAYLEQGNYGSVQGVYAADKSNRNPFGLGKSLGIVMDENKNPVKANLDGDKFDVFDSNNGVMYMYTTELQKVTKTGNMLLTNTYAPTGYTGTSLDNLKSPSIPCDYPDIMVYGANGNVITISACNMGTSVSGTGSESIGAYYQFGNNYPFFYNAGLKTLTGGTITTSSGMVDLSGIPPSSYFSSTWNTNYPSHIANDAIINSWGETTNTSLSRKGPCAEGYHIPSAGEYMGIFSTILNKKCQSDIYCSINYLTEYSNYGYANWSEFRDDSYYEYVNRLKFPLKGTSTGSAPGLVQPDGSIIYTHAIYFHTSSIIGTNIYQLNSVGGGTGISGNSFTNVHSKGAKSVRCIKN